MDAADRADTEIESERAEGIRRATAALRPEVPQLLQHGDVICRTCGDPIPAARLAAFPFAVRCIACQQDHEHDQALGGARR